MKREILHHSAPSILVEALEPRIAPAGLLNESKFTSVTVGTPLLLDASGGPNDVQGLSTGFGANGAYLLYITAGKALVFTSDLNGNGRMDPGEITGIAASTDSQGRPLDLLLFSDVHGDIATNLLPGHGVSSLTDSDNNPNNGRDGRILLDTAIHSITLRTLTSADIDATIPGNTVANRLALTSFSIYGNIYTGGNFGGSEAGLTIDTSGTGVLSTKFSGGTGTSFFAGATPQIGGIFTGSAASFQPYHFTQLSGVNVQSNFLQFTPPTSEHGGDIIGVRAASQTTVFSIGSLETGNGGFSARGGNIADVTLNGDHGGYQIIAGDGGQGATGAAGGSIINFSDLGAVTSRVVLHTGSGGVGVLGAGGPGGTATFGSARIAGDVSVFLGDGGNGFNAGGAGAGLTGATFTIPEGVTPNGGRVITTYHAIGDVGETHPMGGGVYRPETIDFDGDGNSDAVFTTIKPDQIIILLGTGTGTFFDETGAITAQNVSRTITLDAPSLSSTSVTVGDFNGDGRPDVAAASGDPLSAAGVFVFLNQIGDPVRNPLGAANFTNNPLGAHPFSTPLQSATPSLVDLNLFNGAGAIRSLATGDFNGDGILDLGYVQELRLISPPLNPLYQVVGVLFGSPARDSSSGAILVNDNNQLAGSGYFFPNPAAPAAASGIQQAVFITTDIPVLHGTSLTENNVGGNANGVPTAKEVLLYGQVNRGLTEFTVKNTVGLAGRVLDLGSVDTNRMLAQGTNPNFTPVIATLQDFTIQDFDADGNADVVALSKTPAHFFVNFTGNGTGAFPTASGTGDNEGVFLGTGLLTPPATTVVVTADTNSDGIFSEVAVLQFPTDPMPRAVIREYSLVNTGPTNEAAQGNAIVLPTLDPDQSVSALGAFYPIAASAANPHPGLGYVVLSPYVTDSLFADIYAYRSNTAGILTFNRFLTSNGIRIFGGDGGNSTVGSGGNAGLLGGTLAGDVSGNAVGSIAIVFPAYVDYAGNAFLTGGNGGNGFTTGGLGGDIQGVSVRYSDAATILSSDAQLASGNGGNGVSGAGGRGGNVSQVSIATGSFFSAGNGGTGLRGGDGGSVIGNTQGVFDTSTSTLAVITGGGGQGALGGGTGGNISSFRPTFLEVIGGVGGPLAYVTGPGGSAAGGVGGTGGGISDSSPSASQNSLAGDLTLSTGAGGNGLIGGTGGAITNFVNQPTDDNAIPQRLNVLTGNGGIGVSGVGGAGGSINNFRSNATGLESGFTSPLSGTVRIVAGAGGPSYSGTGGAGGNIQNTTALATSTPIAAIAGAGGTGLTTGGVGGSIMDSVVNSAAQQFGKVLAIAGAGGDALAATRSDIFIPGDPDTNDLAHALLAFGGARGLGGNGGNINNFTQPASTATAVDLIAGNGGSTINAGSPVDAVSGVGQGGSVVGVRLAGTVGSINRDVQNGSNPAIKAYNDTGNPDGVDDETLAVFVANTFRGTVDTTGQTFVFIPPTDPSNPAFVLSDAFGNVGIVAGTSGRLKGDQGPADGVNGSVQNISANSILSIVAGSVNRVAPVRTLSGITVTNPDGVLGADKSPGGGGPNGVLDYIDDTGAPAANLQAGYRLVDGAIFTSSIDQPAAPPLIAGPRVFSVAQG